jgi:virulence surface antigen
MAITYAGVTPVLKIDTRDLQDTEKLSKKGNTLVANRNGVCMSMVVDWIQKSLDLPGGVTEKSQLKSGLGLSLAQTAYMRHVFKDADGFVETHGMSVNASTSIDRKKGLKGLFQKDPLISVATACAGLVGYAQISIFGDGGHALGYRQKDGVVQFFDPNEGILEFASSQDFAKWFPPFIKGEYPDLLDEVILRKVKA